ncbi:uncharacterized protein LOC117924668 isoform X2 [Vitis riparia]|uniref:uncharacterized protein LOC117924668 isoform X2 n=1 Tax=Vitis riparia TaxID=96939 RepID=UPI00155AD8FF|nr:uncharacterized protein LOC117924668 isoform X2 [Vitis riparia]
MVQRKGSTRVLEDAEELVHVPLQAILLADSFAQKFRPITLERPKNCYIDICSPEVLSIFTDNFDYQHWRHHFIKGLLVDDEVTCIKKGTTNQREGFKTSIE